MLKGLFGASIEPPLHYFLNIFLNEKNILKNNFYHYYEYFQNMINQG
jgi:hypothetical protein